jgi:pilus assembly protein CpaF
VAAALDVVVHVTRSGGVRHVASVALLRRHARGAHVETALAWAGPGHAPERGVAWPQLAARLGLAAPGPTVGTPPAPTAPREGSVLAGAPEVVSATGRSGAADDAVGAA